LLTKKFLPIKAVRISKKENNSVIDNSMKYACFICRGDRLETYYKSYVNTYLQRDIKDLTQVADEMSFYNFMTVVAARTAKPVVYEEIAKDAGISQTF